MSMNAHGIPLRTPLVLVSLCGLAVATLGACGDQQLPDGAAAKVDDQIVTRAAVQRAVVGQIAMRHSKASMPPYLPADISGCVRVRRKAAAARNMSDAEIRRRCVQSRERREAAALQLLIKGQWYRRDAQRRGVPVPTDRRAAAVASVHAGVDVENLRGVAAVYLMRIGLAKRLSAKAPKGSDAQIAAYYEAHSTRYVNPGKRYVQAVSTRTRTQAEAVARELRRGRSPERIVEGARSPGVTLPFRGTSVVPVTGSARQQREALRVARGDVEIDRDGRGWTVYRIRGIIPQAQLSLSQARLLIEGDVQRRYVQEGVAEYESTLRSRYQDATTCAADYQIPECGS